MEKRLFNEYKKQMIMGHPTFFCPVTKKLLDIRKSSIVKIKGKNIIVDNSAVKLILEKLGNDAKEVTTFEEI